MDSNSDPSDQSGNGDSNHQQNQSNNRQSSSTNTNTNANTNQQGRFPGWFPFTFGSTTETNGNNNNNSNNNTAHNGGSPPRTQFFSFTTDSPTNDGATDDNGRNANGGASINPLNSFIQSVFQVIDIGGRPAKKKRHFTVDALKHLKPVKLSELPNDDSDRRCAICFEPFDEYEPEKYNNSTSKINSVSGPSNTDSGVKLPAGMNGFEVDDPEIAFPLDASGAMETHYDLKSESDIRRQISEHNASNADVSTSLRDPLASAHFAVRLPQCSHVFGRSCIVEWLKSNVSCPLCRREIAPEMSEENKSDYPRADIVFYPVALTEVFVPVDWTGPTSSGYDRSDPEVSFPARGEGYAMGHRTGPPPPDGRPSTSTRGNTTTGVGQGSDTQPQ